MSVNGPPALSAYLVQFDCAWENKAANFDQVNRLLEANSPAPGSLIVLPEMFATGFSLNTTATAEFEGGTTEEFLSTLALRHRSCVIGGLVVRGSDGQCRNQALAFDEGGKLLSRYTKVQPFNMGGEGAVHMAGDAVSVFEWGGWRIAPLVCYDLRFPELAREVTLNQGAELLVYIASWPIKRYQHWLTLLQARAIENLAWVIGVNRCGADPQFSYSGRSVVVDPHGVIIADAGSQQQALLARLERETLNHWRAEFPALRDAKARR